jgi:aldehyde dehydrogenase (NAD+)
MNQNIEQALGSQRNFFRTHKTKDVSFRIASLKKLKKTIHDFDDRISEALRADLGKPYFESYASEIGIVLEEIGIQIKHLAKWSKPIRAKTPITHLPGRSFTVREPLGVVLVMAPWNYPFQLLMAPVTGAVAAGNCVIAKPSNMSPQTAQVIAEILAQAFAPEHVTTFLGGRDVIGEILKQRFDYIFFTGGTNLGKIVAEAAARELTPVTLELGGKSPCIIDRSAKLDVAAKRAAWGKFLNAGQTCIAPDYLLVDRSIREEFLILLKKWITKFYGSSVEESPDFPRIITGAHFDRIEGYLKCGNIYSGGQHNREAKFIEPTILTDVKPDATVMTEEIFGPVWPVIEYDTLDEAINFVNSRPKPLALYFFSENRKNQNRIVREISFGGGCINDTVMHLANPYLPFGGIGASGMGSYHGLRSFQTFTHQKAILKTATWIDIPVRYAPYTKWALNLIKKLMG